MTTIRKKQHAEDTRKKILSAAAQEIYRVGYQASSLNDILAKLEFSKGAIYHHFPNKKALGYAVIEEVFTQKLISWFEPAFSAENPLDGLLEVLENLEDSNHELIKFGCPINNIAQEMSALDEDFRLLIEQAYQNWHTRLVDNFQRAIDKGYMRSELHIEEISWMLIAIYQGAVGLSKNNQDGNVLVQISKGLAPYIKSFKNPCVPSQE